MQTLVRSLLFCARMLAIVVLLVPIVGIPLCKLLMSGLGSWRDTLAVQVSQALGHSVELGRVSGAFHHFNPVIRINDAVIRPSAPQGDEDLRLKTLLVELDGLASVRAGRLVLRTLSARGATLNLARREGDGQPSAEPGKEEATSLARWRGLLPLLSIRALNVQGMTVTANDGALAHQLRVAHLSLSGAPEHRRLNARVVSGSGQATLRVQFSRIPVDLSRAAFKGYASLSKVNLSPWLKVLLPEAVSQAGTGPVRLGGSGRFWFTHDQQGWDVRANVQGGLLQMRHDNKPLPVLDGVAARFALQTRQEAPTQLWLDRLSFGFAGSRWSQGGLYLSETMGAEPQWLLAVDRVPLAATARMVDALQGLLPDSVTDTVSQLAPEGELRDVRLHWPKQAVRDFELAADLRDVSVAHWKSAPSLGHVSGQLQMTAATGQLDLDSSGFVLGLESVFAAPWHFDRAAGRLRWKATVDGYRLRMHDMVLKREKEETLVGRMQLDLPADSAQPVFMALEAGLTDARLPGAQRYIPTSETTLSRPLRHWLATALEKGAIPRAGFFLNGWLGNRGQRPAPCWGLSLDMAQARVRFSPDWPAVDELKARLLVDGRKMLIKADKARFEGARVDALEARIERLSDAVPQLEVTASLAGERDTLSHLMHLAPVEQAMDHVADSWRMGGRFAGHLGLRLPLGSDEPPGVEVKLDLDQARLFLPEAEVKLERLKGQLAYAFDGGLTSSGLQGLLHGRPVSFSVHSSPPATAGKSARTVVVDAQGRMDAKTLSHWLVPDLTRFVRGDTDYSARVTANSAVQVVLDSDLVGVTSRLPAPLDKTAGRRSGLHLELDVDGKDRSIVSMHFADLHARTLMALDTEGAVQAWGVHFGQGRPSLPQRGGWVTGALDSLDLAPWAHWWHEQSPQESVAAVGSQDDAVQVHDLALSHILWDDELLTDAHLDLTRSKAAWQLDLRSQQLTGSALVPVRHSRLLDRSPVYTLNIRQWVLPAGSLSDDADANGESADPLKNIDPARLPALDVHLDEVRYEGKSLGHADFSARPVSQGVRIRKLQARLGSVRVQGDMDWTRRNGQHHTAVQADLRTRDPQQFLELLQVSDALTAQSMSSHIQLQWPHSPAAFAVRDSRGKARFDLSDGRLSSTEGSGGANALRLFGVLNVATITRRLKLDFSDLFGSGFRYDRVKGAFLLDKGIVHLDGPAIMESPSSDLSLEGVLDLNRQKVNMGLVVTLPVTKNLPVVGLLLGQPYIAGAVYLFDKVLGKRLRQFASLRYEITGSPKEPEIRLDNLFSGRRKTAKP